MTARLIAIASGKGGVGKTFCAIGLAQALAEAGERVLLVDGDFGLANLDVQLGLHPVHDLSDVLAGRHGLEHVAIAHPAGFRVLPGRSGSGMLAGLDGRALAALLARQEGLVLLDLGAGLGAAQRQLAAAADLLVVLANEEPTSLTDAYAVLKLHRQDAPGGRAAVLANMVGQASHGLRVHAALDAACRNFLGAPVPYLGAVRRDPRVPAAIRAQAPLLTRSPNSPAAEDLRLAAGAVMGLLSPATSPA
ncbi:AAA family ATPase [Roseococcus sp. YIM B11640]|uniref:nucleotide-binding protein n=1 Tax=Roseococcus sp. YIM B11640 TaxID=3133973 RepID=UPI003C7DDC18